MVSFLILRYIENALVQIQIDSVQLFAAGSPGIYDVAHHHWQDNAK